MVRPFRFTLILASVGLGAALAAVGGWRYARASAPLSGPIIVISVDTVRADHLPAYGYKQVKTPAIDQLAADGVVFERAYSHAPQTLPAHAAMLSGRLPSETGVRDDDGGVVKAGERLLPEMLRDRGYATGGIVSTYLLRKATGLDRGFAFFDGDMPPFSADDAPDARQRDGAESERLAERWLASIGTSRAFLFLHLNEPHAPYAPPDRFSEYSPYDGEIAYADEIIARLVRYLKSHQLYDRSTIVVLSDHGEGLGDHGEQRHGLFLYDETIHVPLIVKQEANAGPGRRVSDPVQLIDLVPTVLDLVKAPIPGNLRGRSLKALLDGDGTGRFDERTIYAEAFYARSHFGWSDLVAATDGRYRYIGAPTVELYDLRNDPRERDNLTPGAPPSPFRFAVTPPPRSAASADIRDALERLEKRARTLAAIDAAKDGSAAAFIDPKDKVHVVEMYRDAQDRAADHKWSRAIPLLQQIVRENPDLLEVWNRLARFADRIDRFDIALDAYKHVIDVEPSDPSGYLGAATTFLRARKFDEAKEHAELALDVAADGDSTSRGAAHELLAAIALARHDGDWARQEAQLVANAGKTSAWPAYVDGRLSYDQAEYDEALPLFEQAVAALKKSNGAPIPELHFYTADTLVRLERLTEAEAEFNEELLRFPQNIRARAGLATLYQTTGRNDEAEHVVDDLIRTAPTPDGYALAARLWKSFGKPRQADAVRAQARKAFAVVGRRSSVANGGFQN